MEARLQDQPFDPSALHRLSISGATAMWLRALGLHARHLRWRLHRTGRGLKVDCRGS